MSMRESNFCHVKFSKIKGGSGLYLQNCFKLCQSYILSYLSKVEKIKKIYIPLALFELKAP